ncbi:hypothetical protein [Haloplanus halobius]|uniref:hypothetical protein n=1 Tax=Haloplanus halobius TaxID=2934938 RepID=UPI00200DEF9F|nr:hypothetical protein [Haloplanus sp. XH21]
MSKHTDDDPTADDVYERMEPLEPYTAGELASALDAPKQVIRTLLNRLAGADRIRKKAPEPERTIWVREPPTHRCPDCGEAFEIRYFHPVLQAAQFCPNCGTQLE